MPSKPARLCTCGRVVAAGAVCECRQQAKAATDAARPSAAARGYDAAWRRARSMYLAAFPDCSTPECTRPANEVDHVISIRERPDLRLSWSNFRAFCKPCHSRRTARDQAFGRDRGVGSDF